jgi:AcrR family transcriptional regulator
MKKETAEEADVTQSNCSRPYQLGRRETAMEATRAKILTAARELILGENALNGFSMEAVARQAGVTRMTVYARFESKRGLLEALFDEIGMQAHLRETLPAAFAQPDPLNALKAYIEAFCDLWANDCILHRRMRGFAALDQEFADAISSRNERRHHAFEFLVGRLKGHEGELDREELIQTLLALTSFEFYQVLAGERGPQQVAPILYRFVLAALEGCRGTPKPRTPL